MIKVRISESARRQIKKLDKPVRQQIIAFLEELQDIDNPHSRGKALTGALRGLWRYRVGDYRLICSIEAGELIIMVLQVAHRSKVYKRK